MSKTPDPDQIAAQLRELVGDLVRRVRLEADTLRPRLAATLGYLSRGGAMTTSTLAAQQRVRHQSMTATVTELEQLGYIERHPDPSDRRSLLVTITTAGQARLDDERSRRYGWMAHAITCRLSVSEQQQLAAALPLVARLIQDDSGAEPD